MTLKKCTPRQYLIIEEMLYQLTGILLAVGIAELKISAKEKEIFWDTRGGGMVDAKRLDSFASIIERYAIDDMEEAGRWA